MIFYRACTGCGACAGECPQGCISFFYDDEGFYTRRKGQSVLTVASAFRYVRL
ncbi:MAG TPA: 4Fe-4S binding protein [Defluviitaleaceae bacterium]|nr:4Fe-4S binding protein [Defluviitaleaceae bacterium]